MHTSTDAWRAAAGRPLGRGLVREHARDVDQAGYGRTALQCSIGAGRGSTRDRFAAPRKPRGATIAGCIV